MKTVPIFLFLSLFFAIVFADKYEKKSSDKYSRKANEKTYPKNSEKFEKYDSDFR